jgi:hypothetical protein
VHRVYNTVGNLLLEERVVTLEAGPKILQHRFRYNRDGAVVASISPLGRATQHYYGRDDFLRRQGLNADDEVRDHDALTDRERQAFANRLTTVRRSTFVDVFAARAARGDWERSAGRHLHRPAIRHRRQADLRRRTPSCR